MFEQILFSVVILEIERCGRIGHGEIILLRFQPPIRLPALYVP